MSDFNVDQKNIIDGNIGSNNLIAYNASVPALNRKLKTAEQQSLIAALNEVNDIAENITTNLTTGMQDLLTLVGDKGADETLEPKLAAIGPNIIEGLDNMNTVLAGLIRESMMPGIPNTIDAYEGSFPPSGKPNGYVCFMISQNNTRYDLFI